MPGPLGELLDALEDTSRAPDRAAAIALGVPSLEATLARFVVHRGHLVIRGGARALVREGLAEPEGSPVRTAFDECVARHGDRGVRATRLATTRAPPLEDGRVFTIEVGWGDVGRAAFSPDGARIVAFAWGGSAWRHGDESFEGSWLGQWHALTGEFVDAARAGQFREDDGTFAISPDMARVAVRSHRDTHVHELDRHTHRVVPGRRLVLDGNEGPDELTFLDDRRLLGNHGHDFEIHDCVSGQRLVGESSVGSCCAVAARRGRLFVGWSTDSGVAIHALPSLVMVGMVVADDAKAQTRPARSYEGGPHVAALAISPSERWLASGDWLNTVRLWSEADLTESGTPREPRAVRARIVGKHLGWVSAVVFVDDTRLLSAGWDGAVLEWSTVERSDREEPVCVRAAHANFVTSLTISEDRKRALSSANDGKVIVWDLERGASPRPLFSIPYGNHSLPVVLRVGHDDVRVAVGTREAVFDHRGLLLEIGRCELPEESKRSLNRFVRVESPEIEAVDVCVEAFDRPEEADACRGDAPSLVIFDESPAGSVEVLDIVALEAPVLAFAWVDARTLVVLDAGGHVAFWSWK